MPPSRLKRWVRRGLLGAALLGSMYALGHQIHKVSARNAKTRPASVRVEPAKTTRPVEGQNVQPNERRVVRPAFVENFLRRNMNAGNIQQVQEQWTGVARQALRHYQNRPGPRFIPAPEPDVNAACANGANATGIPQALLKAIMRKESQYDPYAVSNALAMGPMQLKPDAMAELVRIRHPVENPFDLSQSAIGGGYLLQHYMNRCRIITHNQGGRFVQRNRIYEYEGQNMTFNELPIDTQYRILLRTYNAGPGILGEYMNRDGAYQVGRIIDHHYPRDIMNFYNENQGR